MIKRDTEDPPSKSIGVSQWKKRLDRLRLPIGLWCKTR